MLAQHPADRLHPEAVPVGVDEVHYLGSRGSSSRAKKADAALEDLVRSAELLVLPLEVLQALAVVTAQPRPAPLIDLGPADPRAQVSRCTSSFSPMDSIAFHCDGYSC